MFRQQNNPLTLNQITYQNLGTGRLVLLGNLNSQPKLLSRWLPPWGE